MDSFVYIWTNTLTNQKYIGVHKGNPDDGYVCSSKIMLEDYQSNPSIFRREIIAFGSFDEMYDLETRMLHDIDAAKNPNYYNQSNNNGKFFLKRHTEKTRNNLRQKALNRPAPNKGIPNPKQSDRWKKNNPMHAPDIAEKSIETRKKIIVGLKTVFINQGLNHITMLTKCELSAVKLVAKKTLFAM